MPFRQQLEHDREEQGGYDRRSREIHEGHDDLGPGHCPVNEFTDRRENGAHDQGDEEKKSCADHEHERK